MAKKCIGASQEMGLATGLSFEKNAFHALYNTQAKQEGTSAFIAKRKANFKNI